MRGKADPLTEVIGGAAGASAGFETGRRQDRRRAPETAAKILDAAEALFSLRGFHGVSLRDIASEAGVQVALTHYHFGSKDALFRAVIDRRAQEHVACLSDALREALAVKGSRTERRKAIIRSFILPIVDKAMRGGTGWKHYIRLMSVVANMPQQEEYAAPFGQHFDALVLAYISALKDLHPDMEEGNVYWCFFFYQAMITHILSESGMLDRQSGGVFRSDDLDAMVDRMVDFVSAGFMGLGAGPDTPRDGSPLTLDRLRLQS